MLYNEINSGQIRDKFYILIFYNIFGLVGGIYARYLLCVYYGFNELEWKLIKINILCEIAHFNYAQWISELISIKLFELVICCDNVATSYFFHWLQGNPIQNNFLWRLQFHINFIDIYFLKEIISNLIDS